MVQLILIGALAVSAVILTITYGVTMPFWSYWEGRALFMMALTDAAWFSLIFALNRHWLQLSPLATTVVAFIIATPLVAVHVILTISALSSRRRESNQRESGRRHKERSQADGL